MVQLPVSCNLVSHGTVSAGLSTCCSRASVAAADVDHDGSSTIGHSESLFFFLFLLNSIARGGSIPTREVRAGRGREQGKFL